LPAQNLIYSNEYLIRGLEAKGFSGTVDKAIRDGFHSDVTYWHNIESFAPVFPYQALLGSACGAWM
jgi:hypothetical protein